jgi:hypothetical protein
MQHKLSFAAPIFLIAVLGCGFIDEVQKEVTGSGTSNANSNMTDTAINAAVGEGKVGIPECDQVLDSLAAYVNNPDDNMLMKAGKSYAANRLRKSIKNSIEQNGNDKARIASDCGRFKTELDRFKAQDSNSNSQQ